MQFALSDGARISEFSFSSYMDEDGNKVELVAGKDKNGDVIRGFVKFPAGKRIISIPRNKRDHAGQLWVDFIKNSPYCRGSVLCGTDEHGNENKGMFFVVDPIRDAKVGLSEAKLLNNATSFALDCELSMAQELGFYYGLYSDDEDILRNSLYEYARLNFRAFNALVESNTLSTDIIVKVASNLGVIANKGLNVVFTNEAGVTQDLGHRSSVTEVLDANVDLKKAVKLAAQRKIKEEHKINFIK